MEGWKIMRIAIIGAGAAGLTLAYRLSRLPGHDVVVYEKNSVGGMAGAVPLRDTAIDKFYRHIFTNDEHIINLIEETGLTNEMVWKPTKNGMYLDSTLYPFTNPIDLITFPKISFLGRIRMGLTVLGAKNIKDYSEMENVSAKEWLIQKAGQSAYETLWEPLLYAKFDKDADQVSGVWIWNKFKLRGSTRRGVNKEYLGYLRGGFVKLYEKLAQGATFRHETVSSIAKQGSGLCVTTDSGEELFDRVVFTGAAQALNKLCAFPKDYQSKLQMQNHKANICMTIILRKPVSDYYWITVAEKGAPFVLMIEHTNMFDDPAYEGDRIVFLSRYLDPADPLFAQNDDHVSTLFLAYLKKMFSNFDEGDIVNHYIFREEYAQPVVYQRHSERILPFETPVDGLYLISMGQIYPQDRGQNYAVKMGEDIYEKIFKR
jgi:protoporphyrinogen oxidase